jgi:hypothetical protein
MVGDPESSGILKTSEVIHDLECDLFGKPMHAE